MGRYWSTDNGKEGKFMFGVQLSTAPAGLGMREQEPASITYYADEEDVKTIKKELGKRYDLLGVPEGLRAYKRLDDEAFENWATENIKPLVWEEVKKDEAPEVADRWWSPKEGYVLIEKDRKLTAAYADIYLALAILTDIEEQGYCELEAEL